LHSLPNSFDFEFNLNLNFESLLGSNPLLPESSETITQTTIDPRILGIPNTLGTGFEDGQLQQLLANNCSPPPIFSPPQAYFGEVPLQNSNPRQPQITSQSQADHRRSMQRGSPRLPSHSAAPKSSYADLQEPTSSLKSPVSASAKPDNALSGLATASPDGFPSRSRIRPRRYQSRWPGCQRIFAFKKDLPRHHLTHVKPHRANYHRCPKAGCNKSFPRLDNCQRHTKHCRSGQRAQE
jgi:hypothetical protein